MDDYRNSDYVFLSLNEINVKSPRPPLNFMYCQMLYR